MFLRKVVANVNSTQKRDSIRVEVYHVKHVKDQIWIVIILASSKLLDKLPEAYKLKKYGMEGSIFRLIEP